MKRISILCAMFVILSACGIAVADEKYEAEERGHALLAAFFLDTLKGFVKVIDFHLSFFPGPDGKMRQWITVIYKDNSEAGDERKLFQVIASCFEVAEIGKLQLQEVEVRPTKGSFNVRASVVASGGFASPGERNWRILILKKELELTAEEKRAAVNWPTTWHFRIFDPQWRRPAYSLK